METIKCGGQTFTILFPDLIRPLNPTELTALRESIQAHGGIKYPILVTGSFGVIDGAHRLREGAALGVDVPWSVVAGLSEDQQRELAISLNRDRRQLTPEEQAELRGQRIERVAKARKAGKSTRQIAEDEGVSKTQIIEDTKVVSGGQGCPPAPEKTPRQKAIAEHFSTSKLTETSAPEPPKGKVTGRDGKAYPAHPPRSGRPVFDDRKITSAIGTLTRLLDDRARAIGKGPGHKACLKALEGVLEAWNSWKGERR